MAIKQYIFGIVAMIAVLVIGLTIMFYGLAKQQASAQVDPNDRFFAKNFCQGEDNFLDDFNYNNGDQLSYDSSGCPISTKVVHRWNEVSTVNKTLITTRMTTAGYNDVTTEIQSLVR